jgi:hypothetical protein
MCGTIFFQPNLMFMKKALKPSLDMADQPTLVRGNTVMVYLTGNSFYPIPKVPLATLQAALDTYTASLAKAEKGSNQDKAQKNADKATLLGLLREQCDYVNETAQGNLTALAGCGYDLSKDPQPSILGTADPKLANGVSGQLISSTPAVNGAIAYKHLYTADPSAPLWSEVLSSMANIKIDDLVPGTLIYGRIIAIGTKGQVTISDVVTKMVA